MSTTNKLRMGEVTPTKLYIGETEVLKAYRGETLVYEKASSGNETWLLNENLNISGTNIYNNIEMTYEGQTRAYPIKSLKIYEYSDGRMNATEIIGQEKAEYADGNSSYTLYSTGGGQTGCSDPRYNVWTFATPPTGDLLTWLQANAVKQ